MAFDRVRPESMLLALKRFGIPPEFIEMVSAIYSDRSFSISDCGITSTSRPQQAGIAQGCPLSPYLFIIVLSVIFSDVDSKSGNNPERFLRGNPKHVFDISYADDTFLAGSESKPVQDYLHHLIEAAGKYGLEPNWSKTLHMQVGHEENILNPSGNVIETATQAQYLGSLLTTTGSSAMAVGKRIGEATGIFNSLCTVWKHTSIPKHRKLEVYTSCVLSKLLFSLECETMRQTDKRRLNAFHCRCLRRIMKIPPSWISHVLNNVVLTAAGSTPLADKLLFQQLVLFGKIAKLPNNDFLRQLSFEPYTVNPSRCIFRRRGRPRLSWQSVLLGHAVNISPQGAQQVSDLLLVPSPLQTWKWHVAENLVL